MTLSSLYKSKDKYKISWFKENSAAVLTVDKDRIGYRIEIWSQTLSYTILQPVANKIRVYISE